jgi:hypothetical protein
VYKRFHRLEALEAYATGNGKVAARLGAIMPTSRHRDCRNVHCVDDASVHRAGSRHGPMFLAAALTQWYNPCKYGNAFATTS